MSGQDEQDASSLKLVEDATTGALKLVNSGGPKKRSREEDAAGGGGAIRRGVIRFMVIVVDASSAMNNRDMRPTRLGVVCSVRFLRPVSGGIRAPVALLIPRPLGPTTRALPPL